MPVTLNSTGITFSDGTSISSPTTLGGIGSVLYGFYAAASPATASRISYLAYGATIAGSSIRRNSAPTATNVTTNYYNSAIFGSPFNSNEIPTYGLSLSFPTTNTTAMTGTWRNIGPTRWSLAAFDGVNDFARWYPLLWVRIS